MGKLCQLSPELWPLIDVILFSYIELIFRGRVSCLPAALLFLIVCNKPHANPAIICENIREIHILAVGGTLEFPIISHMLLRRDSAKSYIEIKHTLDIHLFSIVCHKKYFYTGPRSPGPRSPGKKNRFGLRSPGPKWFWAEASRNPMRYI